MVKKHCIELLSKFWKTFACILKSLYISNDDERLKHEAIKQNLSNKYLPGTSSLHTLFL